MINLSYKTLSASMLKHFKIKLCTGFLCLFVCSLTFAQSKSGTKSSCSIEIQKAESTWENGSKDEAIKLLLEILYYTTSLSSNEKFNIYGSLSTKLSDIGEFEAALEYRKKCQ